MATNFRDFEIVSKDGKIQNIRELCNFVENTPIEPDDLSLLETLCNKLANDDYYLNNYTNEYPLVDSLHVVLLDYYIREFDFDIDQIIDILYIYNKAFDVVTKIRYDGLIYLVIDKGNDVEVFDIKNDIDFINLLSTKNNIRTFVAGKIENIANLLRTKIHAIKFDKTNDGILNEYASNFDIADDVYYGKDLNDNMVYKIKNGLFLKNGKDVSLLHEPTLNDVEETKEKRIVSIRDAHKKASFDLNEFITLKEKALNGELNNTEDIQTFYYEVRYLINTMHSREDDDELNEALEDYMYQLNKIYENHPDVLTEEDKNNIEDYYNNQKKYSRKAA